jgi:glycosyltransferase involved in cell wall biosynthesis
MLNAVAIMKPHKQQDLHVAVICRELGGQGSVPAVALRQAQELARYARVTLLSNSFPKNTDPYLIKHLVTPANFSFLRRFSHVPRELAFAFAVKRCLYRMQEQGAEFDFLHCHAHSLIAVAASGFGRRFSVPCGLVAHGDVFSSPRGTFDWRLTAFFKWAIPRGYALADLIVALSPHMRDRAIACGADPRKVEVVPNGIESGEIGLESSAFRHGDGKASAIVEGAVTDSLKLLFVGTLDQRKGVNVLLRAAKKLKQENVRFSIKIVGNGPLRLELDRLITDYGLSDDVALHGSVPRGDLGKWYQWADVTCVPSVEDPLPTVVLESLVAGTPIVGSAVGGIPFMVQASVNGLLVPPGDSDALAEVLARISRQPDFLRRLKQASTPSALLRFSWRRNGEDLIRAVRKTVNYTKRQSRSQTTEAASRIERLS